MTSKASPRRVVAAERRQKAIALRREGYTFQAIAEVLEVSPTAVRKMIRTALDDLNASSMSMIEEARRLELARLDDMTKALYVPATSGHLGAIDRMLRIMERRARLLGLDSPQKIAPTSPDGSEAWAGGKGLAGLLADLDPGRARRLAS